MKAKIQMTKKDQGSHILLVNLDFDIYFSRYHINI